MKELWLEEVRSIAVDASNLIEDRLKEFDIVLTDEEEDDIHNKIWTVLGNRSNGEYKHHM